MEADRGRTGFKSDQTSTDNLTALENNSLLFEKQGTKSGNKASDLELTYTESKEMNLEKKTKTKQKCARWTEKLGPKSLCPSINPPVTYLTYIIFLLLIWGVMYSLFEDTVAPNSNLFILAALILLSYAAGLLISLIRLPPLLGMLIMGILLRNVGYFEMTGVYIDIVSALRKIAMTVILIKAGLGLDAAALRRLSLVVLRLAFGPCIMEAITAAVVSHFLLGYSWLWGFLLGFILAAVSPAVVVPSLLGLKEQGYGEDKGISTLVIAASSIDDIIAISGFGVVLGNIFSQGSLTQQILQGPLEIIFGLSFGLIWGLLSMYLPHRDDVHVSAGRALMVGGGGLFAVMGSALIDYSGAGPLGCIVAAFVACYGWKAQGWTSEFNPVADIVSVLWMIFQPILFGLIGTEINLFELDGRTVGLGLAVLVIGLIVRVLTVSVVTLGGTLNLKERLFVAVAWFPKATVQAALGPVALDLALHNGSSPEVVALARQVLTIAVISILVTAPLGAIGIMFTGPKLLNKAAPKPTSLEEGNSEAVES